MNTEAKMAESTRRKSVDLANPPVTTKAARARSKPKVDPKGAAVRKLNKAELTRGRIVDAAAYVFRHKGYALTRLSDIAKRARTQTGSIYYHFESREAIVAEVLRVANARTQDRVLDAINALPANADVRERIKAAIHGHLEVVLAGDEYIAAHMRIFDQLPDKLRENFLRVLDENSELWRSLLKEARESGLVRDDINLSIVRLLLIGMMNWSVEWYRQGPLSPEQIADQVTILFFDGIRPR
jgi:AcrR family transcriptional regulator